VTRQRGFRQGWAFLQVLGCNRKSVRSQTPGFSPPVCYTPAKPGSHSHAVHVSSTLSLDLILLHTASIALSQRQMRYLSRMPLH
jgi:hypothetical protein